MISKKGVIYFADKLLLLSFAIFLLFTPYAVNKYIKYGFTFVFLLWLLRNILEYKKRFYRHLIPQHPLNKAFLFFGIACVLSIILSLDFYQSQGIFFDRFLIFVFFFWIAISLLRDSKQNLYFLIYAFLLAGSVIGLGGVRDFIYYSRICPSLAIRLWSVFGKRIGYFSFPLYLTYFIPFSFAIFLFARNKFFRIIAIINLVALFFCLACNGSRIGIISVLLSLFFIALLKKKKNVLTGVIILASIIVLICVSLFSPELKERFKTAIYPSEWSFRLPLYKSAIAIFQDYPLTGAGIGMYEKLIHTPKYELPKDYPVASEWNLHVHNTYLEIVAEMGVIGISAFLLIFLAFFIKAGRLIIFPRPEEPEDEQAIFLGLASSILAMLIFAFGTSIITVGLTVSSYFWFLFGVAASFLVDKK